MTQAEQSRKIAELFASPEKMAEVFRIARQAVIARHQKWNVPLVEWRDGRVQATDPHEFPPQELPKGYLPNWVF